jgi:hypothetical protein
MSLPPVLIKIEASKVSEVELIGLMEWYLPDIWGSKFYLDGYIPVLHSRSRLVEAFKAIKQREISLEKMKKEVNSQSHKSIKNISN